MERRERVGCMEIAAKTLILKSVTFGGRIFFNEGWLGKLGNSSYMKCIIYLRYVNNLDNVSSPPG